MVNNYTINIGAIPTWYESRGPLRIPSEVSYWVRRYLRLMLTHVENMRRRVRYYGTGSRHKLVRRRDDTDNIRGWYEDNNKNTKRRRRLIGQADSD